MNKLTTLTLVVVAMTSWTGCCRGWPRWFGRGDACAQSSMYEGTEMGSGPALMAPTTILPSQTLPGPVVQ